MEIPPKPNRNATKIILIEISLQGIEQSCITPLVNSNIPHIIEFEKSKLFIPNNFKKGYNTCPKMEIILLFFKIDNITLKSTTKPPIITTVLILDMILFPKISPKLEKLTSSLLLVLL